MQTLVQPETHRSPTSTCVRTDAAGRMGRVKALQAASALLLGIAATGTIVWYALWRARQRLARATGRRAASSPPTGLFVIFTIAVMLAAAPLVIAVADPAEEIDRIGAAVLLLVIALSWGVVARRRLRRDS